MAALPPNAVPALDRIVGASAQVTKLKQTLVRAARTNIPILLKGESGVGKTFIAKVIHELSGRPGAFVAVNLAALSPSLAAAELFGYNKGAFTGAVSPRRGLVEAAQGGTLFFDEVEGAPAEIQPLLVRLLSSNAIQRLGDASEVPIDFRTISSLTLTRGTGPDIRRDLLDRLGGIVIEVPPLRDHPGDIPELAQLFLSKYGPLHSFSQDALIRLKSHAYPGNVRELESVVRRAASMSNSEIIVPDDLGLVETPSVASERRNEQDLREEIARLTSELNVLNRTAITANPIWEGRRFISEEDYCFVLMPFAEVRDIQQVYEHHIKPVLEGRCGLRCERADDIADISGVMQSVWESINRARLIVADMTERNPNVFYELGIAHTLGKPVVMVTQSMEYVPFDLKHLRCIVYEYKPSKIQRFEETLEKTVGRVLSSLPPVPRSYLSHQWLKARGILLNLKDRDP
jgi:transcriptional regulator with AAA-type ATPase domain